jgi:hypothetical protein
MANTRRGPKCRSKPIGHYSIRAALTNDNHREGIGRVFGETPKEKERARKQIEELKNRPGVRYVVK